MTNLLTNAVKYTKEGFIEIQIHWEQMSEQKGARCVRIKDTGIGMKKEDVRQISESFVRFDNRQTRSIQGIGLGLTIVTRLLYQMQSTLKIESEHNKGSEFSFQLSQEVIDATPIGKIEQIKELVISRQMTEEEIFVAPEAKILAVDDNETNLDLFPVWLPGTESGAEVRTYLPGS